MVDGGGPAVGDGAALVAALRALGEQLDLDRPGAPDPVAAAVQRIAASATPRAATSTGTGDVRPDRQPAAAPAVAHLRGSAEGPAPAHGRRPAAWRHSGRRPRARPGAHRARRRLGLTAAAVVVAVAGIVAVPGTRGAVARLLGIGGVSVVTSSDLPEGAAGEALLTSLGDPVDVDTALARAPAPIVPDGLPAPVAGAVGRPAGAVTLVWPATDDLPELDPAHPTGLGLVITAFPWSDGPPVASKEATRGATIEPVEVGGRSGYWVSGAPHELTVLERSGEPVPGTVRLAVDTLLWADGATTYRLESGLARDAAVALAERIPVAGG